tara:strand:+ start:3014 stop:3910 length:897 start_codon:yes stop_codon:yes gene_type:complete
MKFHLKGILNNLSREGRPNLHDNIAITWIRYEQASHLTNSGFGANWSEDKLFYPASIVKLIYGIAIEVWLEKELIIDQPELRRAQAEMLVESSNDATSFIVDVLTGTNSGTFLSGEKWRTWQKQRKIINKWLEGFNWKELEKVNCCQKTWNDGPFGRDKQFYGKNNENRNAITSSGVARILEALMTNRLISHQSSTRLKKYLLRSLDLTVRKLNPENQVDGFIGEGLPSNIQIWSKAGLMSEVRHDAAWWLTENKNPVLLIVLTKGKKLASDNSLLPQLAKGIYCFHENHENIKLNKS